MGEETAATFWLLARPRGLESAPLRSDLSTTPDYANRGEVAPPFRSCEPQIREADKHGVIKEAVLPRG